ncbi:hypothetical protein OHT52_07370 [Streptomyces sp. NBC_00247]|uniref:hypothetical protein n=1 Tax=Streptomyces sp. NBC_00247 TaxID=2975689 RepID=UPI002E2C960F|nr:hypothetical protein [Streptomyces sp. NBC_00247]
MRAADRRSSGWRLEEDVPGGPGPRGGAARRGARLVAGILTACAVVALYLLVLLRGDLA